MKDVYVLIGEAWRRGHPVSDVSDGCTSCRVSPAGLGGDRGARRLLQSGNRKLRRLDVEEESV